MIFKENGNQYESSHKILHSISSCDLWYFHLWLVGGFKIMQQQPVRKLCCRPTWRAGEGGRCGHYGNNGQRRNRCFAQPDASPDKCTYHHALLKAKTMQTTFVHRRKKFSRKQSFTCDRARQINGAWFCGAGQGWPLWWVWRLSWCFVPPIICSSREVTM